MITYSFSNRKNIYTVWDLTISYSPIDDNRRYKVFNYKYIKRTTEPQTNIDPRVGERLRSFSVSEIEFTNNHTFRFGKYAGKSIKDVNDVNYTCWYHDNIADDDHKKYVHEWLYDHWCGFRTNFEGKVIALRPSWVKRDNEIKDKREKAYKEADGKEVYLEITSNPNADGKVTVDDVVYTFPAVTPRYYDGFTYFLPLLNGKAKRIKNKTIKASLMTMDDEIFIANFSILK